MATRGTSIFEVREGSELCGASWGISREETGAWLCGKIRLWGGTDAGVNILSASRGTGEFNRSSGDTMDSREELLLVKD